MPRTRKYEVYQDTEQFTSFVGLNWFWLRAGEQGEGHGPYWKPFAYMAAWLHNA